MPPSTSASRSRIGIIIPACDEAPAIGRVLEELLDRIDPEKFCVAVGVNGSTDATAEIARRYPVLVAETPLRGYGFGCRAAIEHLDAVLPSVSAYVFYAADGASDPRDLGRLAAAFSAGEDFVLGARTRTPANWPIMRFSHVVANLALAAWCGVLAGRWFSDLAPLRLIERDLFHELDLREMTFGWTIEAQIVAARLGARVREVTARERRRLAGEQKVSGVTWRRTFSIGCRIVAAGLRARRRCVRGRIARNKSSLDGTGAMLPHPHRGS